MQSYTKDNNIVISCELEGDIYPTNLYINDYNVICKNNKIDSGWEWYICESSDSLSNIYGGISDTTPVRIVFKSAASININGGGSSGSEDIFKDNDYLIFDDTDVVIDARLLNKTSLHMICAYSNQTSWDWDLPNVQTMSHTFNSTPMTTWNIELPKVTSMDGTFLRSKITEWNTPLPSITDMNTTFGYTSLKKINISLDTLVSATSTFRNCYLTEWNIDLPKLSNGSDFIRNNPIVSFTGNLDSLKNGYDFFWACPSFTTFNSALPSLENGSDMFGATKLNKQSVLNVLESIPRYTSGSHGLMIGIHIDHKYDPDVQLALKRASINYVPTNTLPIDPETGEPIEVTEGKGWTLTVQWNGTATENAYPAPTTYSLRPMPVPVYAKVKNENDEVKLSWGHFVENWEDNGYQEFLSLEEAYEFFNLEFPKEILDNSTE